jgi:hypothetical protein
MTFHLTRARAAAAALAGLLAVTPCAPAAAELVPVDPPPTLAAAPCATGEIIHSTGAGPAGASPGRITLEGWVEPCAALDRPGGFGVMRYYATHGQPHRFSGSSLYPYDPAALRTRFTFDFGWVSGSFLRALCVARDIGAPLACVAVDPPDGPFARRLTPIPVDDSRITSVPVSSREPGHVVTSPACGNCV